MVPEQPLDVSHLHGFTLGDWLVEPRACRVSRGDTVVKLRAQLIDLLVCLARREGEIALKDEILAEVWPGQYIAESGLSRCIAELRHVLHDEVQQPRYIETITKRGYRVVAPVVWLAAQESTAGEPGKPAPDTGVEAEAGTPVAEATETGRGRRKKGRLFERRAARVAGLALLLLVAGIVAVPMLVRAPAKVLTERDPVLLAFDNTTGEAVFDETIPLAVSIHLEQSPYLALLSPGRIQETLQMMKRPADTPITTAVGLEICERVGARALIVTSIVRLGQQYVIDLEAVSCGTGSVLARKQAAAERKELVLEALQRAAGDIRLAVGESAGSLQRYQVPIVEATTVSLDALRAVRRGDLARARGQFEQAAGHYREAVALDGTFALAHSRLGSMTLGPERFDTLQKAYALRYQVTFPERLDIEATYHRFVTGDTARLMDALEQMRQTYPRRAPARRGLAVDYMDAGRYGEALNEALVAVRLEPDNALNLIAAGRAHLYLNHVAEARQAAEAAVALGGTVAYPHVILFWCAVAANDGALLARERAWTAAHPESLPDWSLDYAEEATSRGRLTEAIGLLKEFEAWAAANSLPDWPVSLRLRIAYYEALCGRGAQALRRVDAELRAGRLEPAVRMEAANAAVAAGTFDVAERVLDEIDRSGQPGESTRTMARTLRGAIAAGRGRHAQSLDLLAPLQPLELGYAYGLGPLFVRATAHYLAGDWANARAAFENILAHRTITSGYGLQPHARLGLARTLVRAGDIAAGRNAYEQFFEQWRNADPDLPLLLQARREYAALQK